MVDTVKDIVDGIEALSGHVTGSLFYKSFDESGCTIKWLTYIDSPTNEIATRHELFMTLDQEDCCKALATRTVLGTVKLDVAH